jgi:hypothetical protein
MMIGDQQQRIYLCAQIWYSRFGSSKPPGGNYHANVKSLSFQHVISWFVEINVDVPVFFCMFSYVFIFWFKRVFLVWFVGVFVCFSVPCSMHIWSQCEVWPHRWIFGLSCFSHGTVLWIVANNQWGATWYTYIISYIYMLYIYTVFYLYRLFIFVICYYVLYIYYIIYTTSKCHLISDNQHEKNIKPSIMCAIN